MRKLLQTLFGWLSKDREPLSDQEAERLLNVFRTRYHDFKLLLAANNKALQLMAEMEVAQGGERIFGMAFVQARCTALLVSVVQMVRHLERLAPDKYSSLDERLGAIQDAMDAILSQPVEVRAGHLIVPLDEIDRERADEVGGKMANLGEIHNRLGLPVPAGFAITTAAYHRFFDHNDLQSEINRLIQTLERERIDQLYVLSSQIQQQIVGAELPEDLQQAFHDACARLEEDRGCGVRLAVRSSAVAEDTADCSFAGQYASRLNVDREGLAQAYKEVVASKYSAQAIQYRFFRGLRDRDLPMAVGCLAMVDATSGGVAYSCSAVDEGDDHVHIAATWGLPKGVVDGDIPTDRFVVARSDPPVVVEHSVGHKDVRFTSHAGEGVVQQPVSAAQQDQPSLSETQIAGIAQAALKLERHHGSAQDVEWAIDPDGELVILQSRPLRQAEPGPAQSPEAVAGAELMARGGTRVSPGVATGPIHWVRREADALTFPDGAILALRDPAPRWAALLGRASGIVAARGGIAGHLATVAREHGRPALFGLGEHTDSLAQGQIVTLDADGRAIYRGLVAELVARQPPPRRRLMFGSPVHQSLTEVLEHVTPLTMLDPDSPAFRADRCQTLHDITRFCHEMSVREMFRFGKDHRLPQRASKQLHYKVPMQWWVLNLDDGFHHEVKAKYVKLQDIACQPMLVLWDGMIAIPWDGPPAISGRGLASVMFEATRNPALSSPFRKPYGDRNYFMIAKQFMNLQSRFGFHFTTVETLMSERTTQNYIRFMFQGGAADLERRTARVHFIGELLEDHDFVVELRDDTALARLSGVGADVIGERLKVIGYLLMHTRQLDMIMANPAAVRRHREKMDRDIQTIMESDS